MIPMIIGMLSAGLFLALSMWVYGVNALGDNVWVALVFWGLIGSGFTVFSISWPKPAWVCRLSERLGLARWLGEGAVPCEC